MITTRKQLDLDQHRSVHIEKPATTPAEKRRRLERWLALKRLGFKGRTLYKRAKMQPVTARKWARELDFDLKKGGLV